MKTAVLITQPHGDVSDAMAKAEEMAEAASFELITDPDQAPDRPEVCIVLGGDGSILYALRRFANTGVPVFGVNYGTIGFLAAVEPSELEDGLRRAFAGDFDVMPLPALEPSIPVEQPAALNDVSFIRRPEGRVAELSYRIGDEEVGNVRCDGLVAATPAGSTGYNLANAGPILAWGVKGYVVSFIAPHTLTARALVVAPGDVLHVGNAKGREPVEIHLDGDVAGELAPGEEVEIRFREEVGSLAQLPSANFYHRIREKFGRLAR